MTTILIVGSSVALGSKVAPSESWAALLTARSRQKCGASVINLAKGGTNTSHWVDGAVPSAIAGIVTNVKEHQTDKESKVILVVSLSLNNEGVNRGKTQSNSERVERDNAAAQRYKEGIKRICEEAKTAAARFDTNVIVCVLSPYPNGRFSSAQTELTHSVSNWLREAAETIGYEFIDILSTLAPSTSDEGGQNTGWRKGNYSSQHRRLCVPWPYS